MKTVPFIKQIVVVSKLKIELNILLIKARIMSFMDSVVESRLNNLIFRQNMVEWW